MKSPKSGTFAADEIDELIKFRKGDLLENRNEVINIVSKNICKTEKKYFISEKIKLHKDSFLNNSEEKVKEIFGKKGSCLYEFLNMCNVDHPDILQVFNGLFNESEFKSLIDFIDLVDHSGKKCPNIREHVKKSARQYLNLYFKKSSFNSSLYIRLLKDSKEIKRLRNNKKSSCVHIDFDKWTCTPDDFFNYCYGVDSYDDEVKLAVEKSNALKAYGLNEFSKVIMDSIATKEEKYFGFNRLNMGDASIILAKQHGYALSLQRDLKVFASPISAVPLSLSGKAEKIIKKIEKFRRIGQKPLFDHLIVMYVYGHLEKSIVKHGTRLDEFSSEKERCTYLLKNELISPIILGERSGKCYFVSYWS